ncbi:extracellular solute-binding protein family 5 (plasmid) [Ketogulonicigenium vulgare Y25]|uniref:Twin-arginine translocation pathway signal n=1 Tax=Ketogulonicigenium vulgare (strain WSH-001) TaxID=759362 RepID=F9YBS0_KETVW|nr:ABC transporter substrate-binding protein [Ketogulonicigenium vulgare]ADO44387.1 extracellular solute-binding protein family 5 [Ketogulonicigenium vulgare Y25]AEM42822.1 Twin-arginine translocation pathway signal [Ketogulonicigenium vulgare WSH-001]ALJ82749.1 twin-arginine translocation pathway signal protein [Ketogulonicigenium vulgare]
MSITRRALLRGSAYAALGAGLSTTLPRIALAQDTSAIRPITLYSRAQAANPQQYQSAELIAQAWSDLGLQVTVNGLPQNQLSDIVWYNRNSWDVTMWQMVGRPERSDPDDFVMNLFHSSNIETGYNFVGYNNPDYDAAAEQQRLAVDRDARHALIIKAQELVNADQPYSFLVYPTKSYAFDKTVLDGATMVNQPGLGIRNFLSYVAVEPLGAQRDLITNTANELNAINPFYISGGGDSWITECIWDRVMRIGEDGLPQPWAAESVVWDEAGTTATITLRDGMTFHDGQPVRIEDVIFSLEAPQGENVAPMYRPFVTPITAMAKVDDRTMTLTLDQPNAAFETSTLSKMNIVPEHVWSPLLERLSAGETAESVLEESRIGSGPFKFDRWNQSEVVLSSVKDHFAAPKMDRVIMRVVLNVEAALGMLRSGELNFLTDYTGDPQLLLDAAAADGDIEVVDVVDMGFQFLGYNLRRAPFSDPAFRRALSFAINRRLILGAAYNGFGVPANSHVSPALPFWYDTRTEEIPVGPEVAIQMLEEAGYSIVNGRLHYPAGQTETLQ